MTPPLTASSATKETDVSSPDQDQLVMAIARCIIGPRCEVPASSKYTLEHLRDVRWERASSPDRSDALWAARSILAGPLATLPAPLKAQSEGREGIEREALTEARAWVEHAVAPLRPLSPVAAEPGEALLRKIDLALAAAPTPSDPERVRHVKRGTEYEVVGEAQAMICGSRSESDRFGDWRGLYDGDMLTVYRCATTGKLWCRFTDEFRNGRFETIRPERARHDGDGWPAGYQETFDAIGKAVTIHPDGMIGISVKAFYRALSYPDAPPPAPVTAPQAEGTRDV